MTVPLYTYFYDISLNEFRPTLFNIYNLPFLRSPNIGKIKVKVRPKTNYFSYFMSFCTNRKPWKLQHQILFTTHFLIKLLSVKFLMKSLTSNKSILEQKSEYLNSIRVFPFFISYFCENETNKKSLIKEYMRKMENSKINYIF